MIFRKLYYVLRMLLGVKDTTVRVVFDALFTQWLSNDGLFINTSSVNGVKEYIESRRLWSSHFQIDRRENLKSYYVLL